MGQQASTEEQNKGEQVPYTKYSYPKKSTSEAERKEDSMLAKQGITVVNPDPESNWKATKPVELQKLDKVHRFWPILKSSLESIPPQEKIIDGVGYKNVLDMCQRFQLHLGESAKIVSSEQQALASRLRDIEMFSAGIAQQIIKREDKLQRTKLHLQKVNEVEKVLENIHMSLAHCIPLAQSLNNMLPEKDRLETFTLQPVLRREGLKGWTRESVDGGRGEGMDGGREVDGGRRDLDGSSGERDREGREGMDGGRRELDEEGMGGEVDAEVTEGERREVDGGKDGGRRDGERRESTDGTKEGLDRERRELDGGRREGVGRREGGGGTERGDSPEGVNGGEGDVEERNFPQEEGEGRTGVEKGREDGGREGVEGEGERK